MDIPKQRESIEQSLRLIIETQEPEAIGYIVSEILKQSLERKKELMSLLDEENKRLERIHSVLQDLMKALSAELPF